MPTSYKPITLSKFNGKTDSHQFIMSYEAAVASVGGDDAVLAKSFVMLKLAVSDSVETEASACRASPSGGGSG